MAKQALARNWPALVVLWVVVLTPRSDGRGAPSGPAVPTVLKADTAPEWHKKFAGKEGWIGGDGVYSVVLGPKRVLWLFGDTILGTVKDGKRTGATMVNNTIAIQAGPGKDAAVRFVAGKSQDGKAAAFFTPA